MFRLRVSVLSCRGSFTLGPHSCLQPNKARWPAVVVVLLLMSGCGQAPEPNAPLSAGNQTKSDATDEKPPAAPDVGDEVVAGTVNSGTEGNLATAEVTATAGDALTDVISSVPETPARTTESTAGVTDIDSSPRSVTQIVEPTPEQIARWTTVAIEPLQLLACRESNAIGFVSEMAPTPDGRHFITAGTQVVLWSVEADVPEHVFLELTDGQSIKSLAVSPNGKWFAAGDSEGTLRLWSIADRREVNSKKVDTNDVIQIAVSPDGQEIATMSYNDEITTWSANKLEQKNRFKVETNNLKRIEYMTSESLVAAGETTTSWNTGSGKLERTLSPGRYNFTLARSPDGQRFIYGDEDALQLWNVAEAKVEATLAGGFAGNELIAFSPNGKLLATANGFSVRVWDLANGQLVQIMDAFGWPITGLSWLPEANLLLVASENGRTRVWGASKDGASVGLQPLHKPIVMPDENSREPATPAQLLSTMDLRLFPRLPSSEFRVNDAFNCNYEATVSIEEAQLFYRYQLGKAGWEEVASTASTPSSMEFRKHGFRLSVACYEGSQSNTSISVNLAGNYDLRWVPKLDGMPIEMAFENEDTVIYRTKADIIQLETTFLRILHAAGWTAYSRLHASHNTQDDQRDLKFVRNAMTLNVSIGRFPVDPTSYTIQYGRFLTKNSVPVPPDAGFVEYDVSTQPYLVATTAMSLTQAREYYDRELEAEGWLVRDYGRSLNDDQNWLSYVRGQRDLTIGLRSLENGRTLVRIGDGLENSSWQLAKPKPPPAADTAVVGIEAADFPILSDSKSVKFDSIDKSLEFSMEQMPLLQVAEVYTQNFQALGWQLDSPGIKADDYVFLTFVNDKAEIALRARLTDGKSMVSIQGDGLLWTKPLPGGKPVIPYETWLEVNQHPASLDLLDQYETEMRAIIAARPRSGATE